MRMFSPAGKEVSLINYTVYAQTMHQTETFETKWNRVSISHGYNVVKVWLNGRYLGKSLIWGR